MDVMHRIDCDMDEDCTCDAIQKGSYVVVLVADDSTPEKWRVIGEAIVMDVRLRHTGAVLQLEGIGDATPPQTLRAHQTEPGIWLADSPAPWYRLTNADGA